MAACLLRTWVRIPRGTWKFVCCECCMLSGRSPCDELITRPVESYRLWCVVVCDLETSRMWRPWSAWGRSATGEKKYALISQIYFWNKTLYVSDSSSVHNQEFFTVHTAMVYVIQVCWQLASRIRMERPNPARKLYGIHHCYTVCIQYVQYTVYNMYSEKLLIMDIGTVRNMQNFIPKINLRN